MPDIESAPGTAARATTAKVALSTASVYPETTSSAFELAHRLGYDGVEVMVGIDPVAADIDAVEKLRDYHGVPVLAIHAPCLLITQRVWGTDPWAKLERSAEAAHRLDADVVVVHPPFRWQREYGRNFAEGIQRLNDATGIKFCVENMYPWRTPGGELKAYLPGWDPTNFDYEHLTLDLSHASTAGQQSVDLVEAWGDRLRHVHLTDGNGSMKDEHLVPGRGDQRAAEVLNHLARRGFDGHVVLEINSRKSETRAKREIDLAESLAFARSHLTRPADFVVNSGGIANVG
ncbi:sugar phosphate isomerase/epimerase family protein [Microlunatus parietis]|uniref:Sugar phosphate isomerase/epimerase n=1 Tax=Microlunatus parietis TaxID=682979 RepID=A0A7Y9IAP0_9ACTN|nr:sugar phosphate isomerase/epimerase family protein [Microlunatus parietis]NYE73148.1 sugar phosphate isomerase/epimerase [Microlunatus parietis]